MNSNHKVPIEYTWYNLICIYLLPSSWWLFEEMCCWCLVQIWSHLYLSIYVFSRTIWNYHSHQVTELVFPSGLIKDQVILIYLEFLIKTLKKTIGWILSHSYYHYSLKFIHYNSFLYVNFNIWSLMHTLYSPGRSPYKK